MQPWAARVVDGKECRPAKPIVILFNQYTQLNSANGSSLNDYISNICNIVNWTAYRRRRNDTEILFIPLFFGGFFFLNLLAVYVSVCSIMCLLSSRVRKAQKLKKFPTGRNKFGFQVARTWLFSNYNFGGIKRYCWYKCDQVFRSIQFCCVIWFCNVFNLNFWWDRCHN